MNQRSKIEKGKNVKNIFPKYEIKIFDMQLFRIETINGD